jgi:hypothetical protein
VVERGEERLGWVFFSGGLGRSRGVKSGVRVGGGGCMYGLRSGTSGSPRQAQEMEMEMAADEGKQSVGNLVLRI